MSSGQSLVGNGLRLLFRDEHEDTEPFDPRNNPDTAAWWFEIGDQAVDGAYMFTPGNVV
jgi:hypothetical protein